MAINIARFFPSIESFVWEFLQLFTMNSTEHFMMIWLMYCIICGARLCHNLQQLSKSALSVSLFNTVCGTD